MAVRCALFGHPVAHSRSPRIYGEFAAQTGREFEFELVDCAAERFPAALAAFATSPEARGANITLPLKLNAYALCDAHSARAEAAGAVNLVRFDDRNGILGDNTDGAGLVRELRDNLGIPIAGQRVLVIGAGGAARGILSPLAECGPSALVVANRDGAKAHLLAAKFAGHGVCAAPLARPGSDFDLVINATSASLDGLVPAVPPSVFSAGAAAYDLAYTDDGQTAFTQWAAARGARVVHDGWGMLVEQAAESFYTWFGVRPDTARALQRSTNP